MKMFMVKSFIIASLMFISVLTGMQMANSGIHKMKGYHDPNLQTPVSMKETNNDINAAFLGHDFSSHDLEVKRKKLEEMNTFNFFSSMGKKMSDGLTNGSEKLIRMITE